VTPQSLGVNKSLEFAIKGRTSRHRFKVCSLPTTAHGIVGTDYLANTRLDLGNRKLLFKQEIRHNNIKRSSTAEEGRDRTAFTVFHDGKQRDGRDVRDWKVSSSVQSVPRE
jgi:hypothetical protein